MYTWSPGDVISSARLNAIEGDRAPVTVESITGKPEGVLAASPVSLLRRGVGVIGGDVYLFGGTDSSDTPQTNVYKYSVSGNSYTTMASLANARLYLAAVVSGDVYLIASGATAETLRYNVATNTYTSRTAYGTSGCVAMVAIGTNIYFMTTGGTALIRYNTVSDSYTTMAAIPSGLPYTMATDGTNIYLWSSTASYLYNVASNTYSSIANLPIAGSTGVLFVSNNNSLYIGPSGSTRNKNKIWCQFSTYYAPSDLYTNYMASYNVLLNTWNADYFAYSTGAAYGSWAPIPQNESLITFNYNTQYLTPRNFNNVTLFSTYISAFTSSGQGIVTTYEAGKILRNEETGVTGSTVAFKSGEVVNNNVARGNTFGGAAVAAFDAIIIQKG